MLPVAPFAPRHLSRVVGALFIIATLYAGLVASAFDQSEPLKVYFLQSVELSPIRGNEAVVGVHTYLTGVPKHLRTVVQELPSSWGQDVTCGAAESSRVGLWTCLWDSSAVLPSIGPGQWMDVRTSREGGVVRIKVRGSGTRNCLVSFGKRVAQVRMTHGGGEARDVKEFRMWMRGWEEVFDLEVLGEEGLSVSGQVKCFWNQH